MAGVIDFGIRISQQITGDDAVSKLQKLERQIGASTRSIASMESKLVSAKKRLAELMNGSGGNSASIAAVDKMRASIAQLEGDLAKKKGGLGDMLGGLGDAKSAASAQQAMAEMAAMAGPIGAVVAVLALLVTALAAAAYALTSFALSAANAHRSALLLMGAWTGSASAARENVDAIERVADSTALAKSQVEDIGKRLAIAGIDGQRFENTLGAISTAMSIGLVEGASHMEAIIERSKALGHFQFSDRQLRGLGISFQDMANQLTNGSIPQLKAAMKGGAITVEQGVDAMNAAITKRFGAGSAGMMLDFNVQLMKLKEHLVALFKDINIEPFLKAMHDLLSIFDQSTDSGKAMHIMLTKGFDALFDVIARVEPYVKAFLQGMLIAALLVYIGVMTVKKALDEAFGSNTTSNMDALTIATYAGVAVFGLLLGTALALVAVFVVLAAVMIAPFLPLIILLLASYVGFKLASAAIDSFGDSIKGLLLPDLAGPGTSMVDGLVNAVVAGADRFAAAMKAMGQSGMDALNSIFHFGSPSKAMEQRGEWIDEGGARGVSGGAMARAMGGMAAPSDAGGDDRGKGAKGGTTYITIDARGADKRAVDYMMAQLTDAFEGAAIIVGAAPEPEPST